MHVHFLPWVGADYEQGINGRKVLVLGESHYCAKPEDDTPFITQMVITDLLNPESQHEAYKNTYTKFERALAGKVLDWKGKSELWNSVIFYNFVQTPMTGPRKAPDINDFQVSFPAFYEILEQYRPSHVIAWGRRLYDNLPPQGYQGQNLLLQDGSNQETWTYLLSDGKPVQVLPVLHPSAGFSWDYWHIIIKVFLEN